MYYRLGKTKLNRVSPEIQDPYIILSEIVDSGISYESPVLISNVTDLELWFGKSFRMHNYYVKLLNQGKALYLYKPTKRPSNGFLKYFSEIDTVSVSLPLISLPKIGESNKIYLLEDRSMYIWLDSSWKQISNRHQYKNQNGEIVDLSEYVLESYSNITQEPINNLEKIESFTSEVDRIGKIYKLADGSKYIWYGWFLLDSLKNISDFDEENYKKVYLYITESGKERRIDLRTGEYVLVKVKSLSELYKTTDRNKKVYSIGNKKYIWSEAAKTWQEVFGGVVEVESLPKEPRTDCIYLLGSYKYIYYGDSSWLPIDCIPEEDENQSESLNNRDVVGITKPDCEIPYYYPEYDSKGLVLKSNSEFIEDVNLGIIDIDRIVSGQDSLVFDLTIPAKGSQGYAVIPTANQDGAIVYHLFYYCNLSEQGRYVNDLKAKIPVGFIPTVIVNGFPEYSKEYLHYTTPEELSRLISVYCNLELIDNKVYSKNPLPNIRFYDWGNMIFSGNTKDSLDLIGQTIEKNKENRDISIWSKTIGKDSDLYDDSQNITLTIEEGEKSGDYRFIIQKYGYSEVFEGTILYIAGEERLDSIVSKSSKLINCTINSSDKIRTGTFTLRGAIQENNTIDDYIHSLEVMYDFQKTDIYPDFLLVPDIYKFTEKKANDSGYFDIYNTFLDIAQTYSCQVLIKNSSATHILKNVDILPDIGNSKYLYKFEDSYYLYTPGTFKRTKRNSSSTVKNLIALPEIGEEGFIYEVGGVYYKYQPGEYKETQDLFIISEAICGGDFIFNLIEPENRLVYFFEDIDFGSTFETLPAYSIFMDEIFSDTYFEFNQQISHAQTSIDPYNNSELENSLEKYKSNYLTYNYLHHYYKKYLNGETYNTSITKRHIIGKIHREILKKKGKLIAERSEYNSRRVVEDVLSTIGINYPNTVRNIKITEFKLNNLKNSLTISIESQLSDLIEKDITLDITINYNEYGNSN